MKALTLRRSASSAEPPCTRCPSCSSVAAACCRLPRPRPRSPTVWSLGSPSDVAQRMRRGRRISDRASFVARSATCSPRQLVAKASADSEIRVIRGGHSSRLSDWIMLVLPGSRSNSRRRSVPVRPCFSLPQSQSDCGASGNWRAGRRLAGPISVIPFTYEKIRCRRALRHEGRSARTRLAAGALHDLDLAFLHEVAVLHDLIERLDLERRVQEAIAASTDTARCDGAIHRSADMRCRRPSR